MGFLPSEPPKHRCQLPKISGLFQRTLPQGTRWQCDDCQEIWIIRPIDPRPVLGHWAVENPRPPKAPSGAGGIVTKKS